MRSIRRTGIVAGVAIALLTPAAAVGCGDDDDQAPSAGNSTDLAFTRAMEPHHESAIEMAQVANDKAEHAQLRALAQDTIATQSAEIGSLHHVGAKLTEDGVTRAIRA